MIIDLDCFEGSCSLCRQFKCNTLDNCFYEKYENATITKIDFSTDLTQTHTSTASKYQSPTYDFIKGTSTATETIDPYK